MPKLKVGDRIKLAGGYDPEPKWLAGKACVLGKLVQFIEGVAVVELDAGISAYDCTGKFLVLHLRYEDAKWIEQGIVHVFLYNEMPDPKNWPLQKDRWVESHAQYKIIGT